MSFEFKRFCAAAGLAVFLSTPCVQAESAVKVYDPDEPRRIIAISEYPNLVDKLIARKNFTLAETVIEEGLKSNPLSAQLRFQRCVLFEKKGDTEQAIKLLEDFIDRYPEIPEPHNNLAALYSAQGNLDRAEELLKRALALRPNFALAYDNLGNLYLARAKNAYGSALQYAPNAKSVRAKLNNVQSILKH